MYYARHVETERRVGPALVILVVLAVLAVLTVLSSRSKLISGQSWSLLECSYHQKDMMIEE